MLVASSRKKFKAIPEVREIVRDAKRCTACNECRRACLKSASDPDGNSSFSDGCLRDVRRLLAHQVAGVKLGQAGPLAGTAAPRSVQEPLLKCVQLMCVARPCRGN